MIVPGGETNPDLLSTPLKRMQPTFDPRKKAEVRLVVARDVGRLMTFGFKIHLAPRTGADLDLEPGGHGICAEPEVIISRLGHRDLIGGSPDLISPVSEHRATRELGFFDIGIPAVRLNRLLSRSFRLDPDRLRNTR